MKRAECITRLCASRLLPRSLPLTCHSALSHPPPHSAWRPVGSACSPSLGGLAAEEEPLRRVSCAHGSNCHAEPAGARAEEGAARGCATDSGACEGAQPGRRGGVSPLGLLRGRSHQADGHWGQVPGLSAAGVERSPEGARVWGGAPSAGHVAARGEGGGAANSPEWPGSSVVCWTGGGVRVLGIQQVGSTRDSAFLCFNRRIAGSPGQSGASCLGPRGLDKGGEGDEEAGEDDEDDEDDNDEFEDEEIAIDVDDDEDDDDDEDEEEEEGKQGGGGGDVIRASTLDEMQGPEASLDTAGAAGDLVHAVAFFEGAEPILLDHRVVPAEVADQEDLQDLLEERSQFQFSYILEVADVLRVLRNTRGVDVQVLPVRGRCDWTDFMVVATGRSVRHMRGMADALVYEVKLKCAAMGIEENKFCPQVEGKDADHWMLVDCGSIVVHFLSEHGRQLYKLEKLWQPRDPDA